MPRLAAECEEFSLHSPQMQSLVGIGLYPLSQAARLVGEPPRYVRRWLRGYSWKYKSGRSSSGPLWQTEFAAEASSANQRGGARAGSLADPVLGFRDLLELRMVAQFVRHGVSLLIIRATIEEAERLYGAYPLSNREFRTDGHRIFLDALERATGRRKMLDVLGHQFVFREVIKPSLYSGIVYAHGEASRWFPMPRRKAVVLDPRIQFGAPTLADYGVPTDAIFATWIAEGKDYGAVARTFEVPLPAVQAAVAFETQLAA